MPCCFTINPDPLAPQPTHTVIDCCTLKIHLTDNSVAQSFNLNTLVYEISGTSIFIKDGVNLRSVPLETAYVIFGTPADPLALTAYIDSLVTVCKCQVLPPVPETIDVLNCDLSTTSTTFEKELDRVVIVQDKPFVICATPQIDIEHRTVCNQDTDTWHFITVIYTDGVITSETSVDSGISCQDPLPLEPDIEQIKRCDAVTSTIWIDVTRYMTDPGTNVTTSSILQSIDTLEKCNQTEIDYVHTNWLPICVDGVQWYVAEEYSVDNSTGIQTLIGKIYKEGANGVVTATMPIGVIADGACKILGENLFPFTMDITNGQTFTLSAIMNAAATSSGLTPLGVAGFDFDLKSLNGEAVTGVLATASDATSSGPHGSRNLDGGGSFQVGVVETNKDIPTYRRLSLAQTFTAAPNSVAVILIEMIY